MELIAGSKVLDLSGVAALIFDLDGTLVESEHVWAKAKSAVSRDYGATPTQAVLDSFVGRSVSDFVTEYLGLHDEPSHGEAAKRITDIALATLTDEIREIPGAARLVKAAHDAGLRIAICSSASRQAIERSVAFLGIGEQVELMVSAAGMARGKPDRLPYVATLERLGLRPDQAIAFEDSLSGLLSATAAGIATIAVGNPPGDRALPGVVAACGSVSDISIR